MTQKELKEALASHERWLEGKPDGVRLDLSGKYLEGADLHNADLDRATLRGAFLYGADLSGARLCRVDLRDATLRCANLRSASLFDANLKNASLQDSDLRDTYLTNTNLEHADLYGVNLGGACLSGAYLRGADLDYATYPLWCGSLDMKIDKRIAAQLLYHALRAMQSCADEPDVAAVLASKPCLKLANQFHRVGECGCIEPPKEGGAE